MGSIKFNVDDSSLGNPRPFGIGEVLRDHMSRELIKFSKFIGVSDSNLAEVIVVREALVLFVTSKWVVLFSLLLECNPKSTTKAWKMIHMFREGNQEVDGLAKKKL
ncbi:hypothetical protein PTKIN_Ptkin09bG0229100 [Pterospermum kingtungense]